MQNDGNSLGQLDMQLRTANEAIDYISMSRIQRKWRIDESKTKTLHPRNKSVKIAKICNLRKFNPAKVKAYCVKRNHWLSRTYTATWSAMFAHFKCSVSSCPYENTHGTYIFCLLHVCRIGLCARDYAGVMVGMVLTWCMGIPVQG